MLKVVVANANKPRSGKDSSMDHMVQLINNTEGNLIAFKRNFKDKLVTATAIMLNISEEEFLDNYDTATVDVPKDHPAKKDIMVALGSVKHGWWKDVPIYTVGNKRFSKREALIYCSENLFKVICGNRVFGDAMVESLPEDGIVFVGDSGFSDELMPVIEKIGAENVLVVRIHRDLASEVKDSRSLLNHSMFPEDKLPTFIDIENNGTEVEFLEKVEQEIGAWL